MGFSNDQATVLLIYICNEAMCHRARKQVVDIVSRPNIALDLFGLSQDEDVAQGTILG